MGFGFGVFGLPLVGFFAEQLPGVDDAGVGSVCEREFGGVELTECPVGGVGGGFVAVVAVQHFGEHRVAFTLTSDLDELQELLDVSARSIGAFVDATVAGIRQQIQVERDQLTRGTHAERRELVALILNGASLDEDRIGGELGYDLAQSHTAAVVWGDESDPALADLDRVVEEVICGLDGHRPLTVLASAGTRWVWLPGETGPDLTGVGHVIDGLPGVRMAVGSTADGPEGFRRSHLDAITTQRMMARLNSCRQIATFADVELIALITAADPEQTDRFINHTLGEFESADPDLHRTVLTFIDAQCNSSRAAARLFIHRNTLLKRIAYANRLLPRPLGRASVHVAVALEVLQWRLTP